MRTAARPLLFISLATLTALFLSTLWGALTRDIAFLSVLSGGLGWIYAAGRAETRAEESPGRKGLLCSLLMLAAFLIGARYVLSIYYPVHSQWVSFETAAHRIPAFISGVMSFVSGAPFWPQNPVLQSQTYHDFGFSLFAGLPVKLDVPLSVLLPLLGAVLLTLLVLILRQWAGEAALGSFLFMSGTAGYVLAAAVRSEPYRSYLNLETVVPGAMGLFYFVSDPALWYVFPASLLLLWSFREKFAEGRQGLPAFEEVLIWAVLPVFNLMVFYWVSAVGIFWCVFARRWSQGWKVFMPGCLLAAVLAGCLSGFSARPGFFIEPQLQAAFREEKGFFQYALQYGALLLWMLMTLILSLRRSRIKALLYYFIPGAATFLFFTLFDVSGFTNAGAPLAVLGLMLMSVCFQDHLILPLNAGLRALLLCAMFLPGLWIHTDPRLDYLRGKKNLYKTLEVEDLCSAVSGLSRDYRFASTMQTYHPLALCGVPLATIYNDVFFVEGSEERKNSEKVRAVLAGGPGWYEAAKSLNVRYLFWGRLEEQDFGHFSKKPWETTARKIREGTWGAVYDLGDLSALGPEPPEGQGLRVRVFNNPEASGGYLFERRVKTIDFDWKEDSARKFFTSPYGLVFEGELKIPVAGEVDFFLASDDGSRLEIGGEMIIDNSGNHPFRIKQARRHYEPGWYSFRLHYDESWGVSAVRLWWRLPGQSEEVIPVEYFKPAIETPAAA